MLIKGEDSAGLNADLPDERSIDFTLVGIVVVAVSAIVAALIIWPVQSVAYAKIAFAGATGTFGSSIQLIAIGMLIFALILALGRTGDIKLGKGEPQYSTTSWLFMFITAGLGSGTMYWAVVEWAYYYQTPGLNIAAESREALDISTAYAFFHWGPIAWAMYAVAGVAMAHYYYNRGGKRLSFAGNIEAIFPRLHADGVAGRIIDLAFMFCTFGGLIVTTTLTVEAVSAGIAMLTGIGNSLGLKAAILAAVSLVYGTSSLIGIDKGLQKLAATAVLGSLLFAIVLLVVGPTKFIIDNITNATGLEISHFFEMALFTDPTQGGSFPRDWTVFYWLYWIAYLPGFAIFITRVSKGRTIRQTILATMVSGSVGTMFFFGVLSSFAVKQKLTGALDIPALITAGQQDAAVTLLMLTLPLGIIFAVVYFGIMMVFLSSHLDATSYTIASVTTRKLRHGQDPGNGLKLFWVIALAAIPMAMLIIKADLNVLKTGLTLTAIPFTILMVMQAYGLWKWLYK